MSAEPMGRVTGTVLCSDTRKPARGAYVYLKRAQPPGEKSVSSPASYVTDVSIDGTFTFQHVAPGTYVLSAHLDGYRTGLTTSSSSTASITKPATSVSLSDLVTLGSSETVTHDLILEHGAPSVVAFYSLMDRQLSMPLSLLKMQTLVPQSSFSRTVSRINLTTRDTSASVAYRQATFCYRHVRVLG
jgi:hypothetical protein